VGDPRKLLVDRRGTVLDTLGVEGTFTHRISHDGTRVALGTPTQLWVHDLTRRVATRIGSGTVAAWSPADTALLITLGRDPRRPRARPCAVALVHLATARVDTVAPALPGCWQARDWSPDGRHLVLRNLRTGDSATGTGFWAYALAARTVAPLVPESPDAGGAAVSPDGRWLAYHDDASGNVDVYVRPFLRPGAAVRVSADGGRSPRWRRDGRELYFVTPDGRMVAAAVRAAGEEFTVGAVQPLFRLPDWTRGLFFDGGDPFDVRPDGERFVVRPSAAGRAAVLVRNWAALVR
jgi:Tol biopolymer transport system component